MLANKTMKAFVPTVKPKEAKAFYGDVLGLTFLSEDNFALEFDANGFLLRIAIVPELKPHPFTSLGWNVGDIVSVIKALNEKCVCCEKFGFFEQDDLGIWKAPGGVLVAWFKDPDGNILSLTQY